MGVSKNRYFSTRTFPQTDVFLLSQKWTFPRLLSGFKSTEGFAVLKLDSVAVANVCDSLGKMETKFSPSALESGS